MKDTIVSFSMMNTIHMTTSYTAYKELLTVSSQRPSCIPLPLTKRVVGLLKRELMLLARKQRKI
uniref:Alternative protein UBR1 n=1 Tax=Homo sapiens TaxID=9606 RepID=L8E998_HUMAN|nr:alternative protein UBR1 [Homo sapiens]